MRGDDCMRRINWLAGLVLSCISTNKSVAFPSAGGQDVWI